MKLIIFKIIQNLINAFEKWNYYFLDYYIINKYN